MTDPRAVALAAALAAALADVPLVVTKGAGGAPPAVDLERLLLPVAVAQVSVFDQLAAEMDAQRRAQKRAARELRDLAAMVDAIASPAPVPASHGFTEYRPQEWRTAMVPVVPPKQMNGHSLTGEDDEH